MSGPKSDPTLTHRAAIMDGVIMGIGENDEGTFADAENLNGAELERKEIRCAPALQAFDGGELEPLRALHVVVTQRA